MENNHIFWRDEILQLLFWMRGEGMGEAQAPAAMARFLNIEEALLMPHLAQMADDGFLGCRELAARLIAHILNA